MINIPKSNPTPTPQNHSKEFPRKVALVIAISSTEFLKTL